MKWPIASATAIAATLILTACGGTGGAGHHTGGDVRSTTVSVRRLAGVGSVLVDRSGKALYTPEEEASGKILCTGPCNAFWMPLTAGAGRRTAPAGVGKLGVIRRPDGTRQLTSDNKPLYTFAEDSPGHATGNGFRDEFAGHHFIWHLVRPNGAAGTNAGGAGTGGTGGASGYGY